VCHGTNQGTILADLQLHGEYYYDYDYYYYHHHHHIRKEKKRKGNQ